MSHSPGPWTWSRNRLCDAGLIPLGVVALSPPHGPSEEDRAIIAAAPEMLALLRDAIEELDAVSKQVPDNELLRVYLKRGTLGKARALLARIEGGDRG